VQVIRRQAQRAYPLTRSPRVTYTGAGYRDGYAEGRKASIGGARLTSGLASLPRPRS
jgi:hypothetical protein